MASRRDPDPQPGSFDDYFQAYMAERQKPWKRRAQLVGTSLGLGLVAASLAGGAAASLAPAWLGLLQRKRPRTVRNLAWRLRADLLLWTGALHQLLGGNDLRPLRVVESVASTLVETWPEPRQSEGPADGARPDPVADSPPAADMAPPPSPATSRDWAVWQ